MMENIKVMLCCIGRLENPYIREYVEYYKKLGVTNICLYDNNYDGEEDFREVIGDYIDNGFVILKNCRNKKAQQPIVYELCYNTYQEQYDWFLFFDCDEFFYLEKHETIQDFLNQEKFNNFNVIVTSWKLYDDNDQVYYSNKPLLERFTRVCDTKQYHNHWKRYVKTIVRGRINRTMSWHTSSSHFPSMFVKNDNEICDVSGKAPKWETKYLRMYPCYDGAYIKHIETKTIEEFCKIKLQRRWADNSGCYLNPDYFFEKNKRTFQKEQIANMLVAQNVKGIKPFIK